MRMNRRDRVGEALGTEPSGSLQQGAQQGTKLCKTLQRPRPLSEGWGRINENNNSVVGTEGNKSRRISVVVMRAHKGKAICGMELKTRHGNMTSTTRSRQQNGDEDQTAQK